MRRFQSIKGFQPAMQFLSNTLHFTELNYSSKFMWFLEIFKLKSSPFFETFQHYFCDNIFFLNITWFISSPDVRQYLRQCVRHHPETVLGYSKVGRAEFEDFIVIYFFFCYVSDIILPCKEWGSSTSFTKFQILSNRGLKSISSMLGPIQMELTWIWY